MTMRVETNGQMAHAIHDALASIDSEAVFAFDPEGFTVEMVDPANVASVRLDVPADAFDGFDVTDEYTFGVNLSLWHKSLRFARKGRGKKVGDGVAIEYDPEVEKYTTFTGNDDVERETQLYAIDPDSMRPAEGVPWDIDLSGEARVDPGDFRATVGAAGDIGDSVRVSAEGDSLKLVTEGDVSKDTVRFNDAVVYGTGDSDAEAGSLLSLDYLDAFADAVCSNVTRLVVEWGNEFPLSISFQNEETGFSGAYFQAPRVRAD